MHLAQQYCHCCKYFWNSCCGTAFSVTITFFECLQYPEIFVPLRQVLFLKTKVIRSQIRGIKWVFHSSNRFLGSKLLDREPLVSWRIAMVQNPVVEPKFRPYFYTLKCLSKFSCIATVLTLKHLCEWTRFHTFSTFSSVLWDLRWLLSSYILRTLFELFMPLKNTRLFHIFSPKSLREHCTSITFILL